jgi:hypothetical protein
MKRTASQILDEIRSMRGLKSDSQLGKLLGGVGQSTIGSWRARNSIPFEKIVAFCHREGQSLDSLILGDLIPGKIPIDNLYLPETVALMPEIDSALRKMEPLDRYAIITVLVQNLKACAFDASSPGSTGIMDSERI